MLNFLINCLIVLGIVVTILLIATAVIFGTVALIAVVGKIVDLIKDDKNRTS